MTSYNSVLDRECHITSLVQDALTTYLKGHAVIYEGNDFDCPAMAASGAATIARSIVDREASKTAKWTRISISGGTASFSRELDILNNPELLGPNGKTSVLENFNKPGYCKPMDLDFTITEDAGEEVKVTVKDLELPVVRLENSNWWKGWPLMCDMLGQALEKHQVPSSVTRTLSRELRDKRSEFRDFLEKEKIDVKDRFVLLRPDFAHCTVSTDQNRSPKHSWKISTDLWTGSAVEEHLGTFTTLVETPTAGQSYREGTTFAAMGLQDSTIIATRA